MAGQDHESGPFPGSASTWLHRASFQFRTPVRRVAARAYRIARPRWGRNRFQAGHLPSTAHPIRLAPRASELPPPRLLTRSALRRLRPPAKLPNTNRALDLDEPVSFLILLVGCR